MDDPRDLAAREDAALGARRVVGVQPAHDRRQPHRALVPRAHRAALPGPRDRGCRARRGLSWRAIAPRRPRSTGRSRPTRRCRDRYAEHGHDRRACSSSSATAWACAPGPPSASSAGAIGTATVGDLLSEPEQRVYLPLVAPGTAGGARRDRLHLVRRGRGAFLFDVEWMAALDEPLRRRGPRIDTTESLVRFLVVPDERGELIRLRLARSPLLRDRLRADNWHILTWSNVRRLFESGRSDLAALEPVHRSRPTASSGATTRCRCSGPRSGTHQAGEPASHPLRRPRPAATSVGGPHDRSARPCHPGPRIRRSRLGRVPRPQPVVGDGPG